MKTASVILACFLVSNGYAWAASSADAPGPRKKPVPLDKRLARKVNCQVQAKPFIEVLAALQAECKFDAVIDPDLRKKNPKVTAELTNMACSNVLLTLCGEIGALCSRRDGVVSIGYPKFIARVRRIKTPRTDNNKLYLAVIRRIGVDFVNMDLRDAAIALQKKLKVNILVMPSGKDKEKDERVTLRLKGIRGVVALKYVALVAKRAARVEGGIVVFSAPPAPKGVEEPGPTPKPEPEKDPKEEPLEEDF